MALKKVTESQKEELLSKFLNGHTIKDLASKYNFSEQTITRQLRKFLEETEFKKLKIINNSNKDNSHKNKEINNQDKSLNQEKNLMNEDKNSQFSQNNSSFFEIIPLTLETNLDEQKDITTKPFSSINFPAVVYLLVDQTIELQPRLLKEYPEWSFLPINDLNRKTLRIYDDHKNAKLNCQKNQKVIKVPNPNVFFVASKFIKSKGISRIIFRDSLFDIE